MDSYILAQIINLTVMVAVIFLAVLLLGIRYRKSLNFIIYSRIAITGAVAASFTVIVVLFNTSSDFLLVAGIIALLAVIVD